MDLRIDKARDQDTHGEEEIFAGFLRSRGLRLTASRRRVLRRIFAIHDHFTAEDLLGRLRRAGIRASKATVYRTLTLLIDCRLLNAYDFGEGARYFEHVFGHRQHDHLFCVVCKDIEEFRDERIDEVKEQVARHFRFSPLSHVLSIFGLCRTCATRKESLAHLGRNGDARTGASATVPN